MTNNNNNEINNENNNNQNIFKDKIYRETNIIFRIFNVYFCNNNNNNFISNYII